MKRILMTCLVCAIAAITFSGCDDDVEYVTVEGSLGLDMESGETGFEFDVTTPLAATADQATPDCAAGGCIIHLGDDCQPDSFELWIDRGTAGEPGLGFDMFDLTISEGGATVLASVAATDGEVTYSSDGSAACEVTDISTIDRSGDAVIDVECDLAADPDLAAHASAHLVISGCAVER
jgi:hypothetical protein